MFVYKHTETIEYVIRLVYKYINIRLVLLEIWKGMDGGGALPQKEILSKRSALLG